MTFSNKVLILLKVETKQPLLNQDRTETEVQTQQTNPNNSKLFVVIIVSILVTAVTVGSAVYFWQNSTNGKLVNNLEQRITSLEEQVSTAGKTTVAPQPSLSPVPSPASSADVTANWKVYTNNEIYFKYPPDSMLGKKRVWITGVNPDFTIQVATKGSVLSHSECLKKDSVEKKNGLVLVKYSGFYEDNSPLCGSSDSGLREIRVLPTEDSFSPGIAYFYSAEDSQEAEKIFNQILATFKFLD